MDGLYGLNPTGVHTALTQADCISSAKTPLPREPVVYLLVGVETRPRKLQQHPCCLRDPLPVQGLFLSLVSVEKSLETQCWMSPKPSSSGPPAHLQQNCVLESKFKDDINLRGETTFSLNSICFLRLQHLSFMLLQTLILSYHI